MRTKSLIHSRRAWVIAAVLLSTLTAGCQRAPERQMDWQPPGFTVIGADGGRFSYPDDLEGPTIVLFWATWCPYCKALMPHLQSILDEFPGQVRVLALNIREDADPAAFLAEYGYDFQLVENADRAAELWGVKGTPGLFLADASGRVVFDRLRIPAEAAAPSAAASPQAMKHYQKAARSAPLWAARLRVALDPLLR
jgi:thiol-disulfide isomerase/thioredoxin